MAKVDLNGSVVLGCAMTAGERTRAVDQGAGVIDAPSGLPFDPFRTTLYAIEDLYDRYDPAVGAESWKRSFDYRCYLWFMDEAEQMPRSAGTSEILFSRIHDSAQEAAIARFLKAHGRRVVGFMGGHDVSREASAFRRTAELARRLARAGLMVLTGGGPGLMEAANLGAFLSAFIDDRLDRTIAALSDAPTYKHPDWLATAWRVRTELVAVCEGGVSLGVPTWRYGFEPPNVFAARQAKMFHNSLREDGLVTLADAGLVIGPGNAGTVQEIFQDVTQNYYRKPGVAATPVALMDVAFWTRAVADGPDRVGRTKPLAPLLEALAGEREATDFSDSVLISDDMDAIAELILRQGPKPTRADIWTARCGA